jgi:hypothetical protein
VFFAVLALTLPIFLLALDNRCVHLTACHWPFARFSMPGATRWSKTHLLGLGALHLPRLRATRSARDTSPYRGG